MKVHGLLFDFTQGPCSYASVRITYYYDDDDYGYYYGY